MYLLIDVRTSSLADIPRLHYAHLWVDIWMEHHPHDRITFLAFEGDPVEGYECIFLPRRWGFWSKKLAAHTYGPQRIISFSVFAPIDRNIPTIAHLDELTRKIYPEPQISKLYNFYLEYSYKKLLKSARHIIIPSKDVGIDLSEFYSIKDEKMAVIPYVSVDDALFFKEKTLLPHGIVGDYYITEGTRGDEWNPRALVESYGTFIRNIHDDCVVPLLVIIGDIGANLTLLNSVVNSLGLSEKIRTVGILSKEDRYTLYAQSLGWIYIGAYYSRSASVSLAQSLDIPLYMTDVSGLREYPGYLIHPNRVHTLSDILSQGGEKKLVHPTPDNKQIMEVYTRMIAE